MPDAPRGEVEKYTSEVHRVGDTVRRTAGPWTPAVHAFLAHLDTTAPGIAPQVLGQDAGVETLSHVAGTVPDTAGFSGIDDAAVHSVGALVRRMHLAARSFRLPHWIEWPHPRATSSEEPVVCHNDLSPRNTVFREGEAVAFIDWDFAGPEDALWDVAHAVWQFAPLMDGAACRDRGWIDEPPDRAERARAFLDGYGLDDPQQRGRVLALVPKRISATLHGIEALARQGQPAARRLAAEGVPQELRANLDWFAENAPRLTARIG